MVRFALSMLILAVALVACSVLPGPTQPRPLGPGERWLPTANLGPNGLCAGGGFIGDTRLHGSPDDARLAWMINADGQREELAWPVGYSARFTPKLEVLNEHAQVVAAEGSLVTGGCPTFDRGVTLPDFATPAP